jgi:hypothetical protein
MHQTNTEQFEKLCTSIFHIQNLRQTHTKICHKSVYKYIVLLFQVYQIKTKNISQT